MRIPLLPALTLGLLALAAPAAAQSRAQLVEAFAGEWYVFDSLLARDGNPCALVFKKDPVSADGRMAAAMQGCTDAIGAIASWSVEGGVLRLFDAGDEQRAELGGSQRRITGVTMPGQKGLVVERAGGDGAAQDIAMAVQRHRCYYAGTTATCATEAERAPPAFPATGEPLAEIEMLGNLVVRDQPRRDASTIGTIPSGACIKVNQCLTASDGIWCRARFGEVTGWLAKTAVRQGEWPIITYRNTCPAPAEAADAAPAPAPAAKPAP